MRLPYGIANFHKIITQGYYYADRTDRIRTLEGLSDHVLFLRPRRFGKTAWLTTLENYYDLARAGEFDALFGALAIGAEPTARRNSYFVLRWDFSMVDASGSLAEIRQALHNHNNAQVADFAVRYAKQISSKLHEHPSDGLVALGFERLVWRSTSPDALRPDGTGSSPSDAQPPAPQSNNG